MNAADKVQAILLAIRELDESEYLTDVARMDMEASRASMESMARVLRAEAMAAKATKRAKQRQAFDKRRDWCE